MVGSGFRDREAQHVTWRDIDFQNSVVRVMTKPIWGFRAEELGRRFPFPYQLVLIQQLQEMKKRRNSSARPIGVSKFQRQSQHRDGHDR